MGLGLCLENFELRQKASIGAGKYNEHNDEYVGIGPSLSCLWKLANGNVTTGFNLGMLFTLPYASQSIIKTDGCYSDKAYIWWLKPRLDLFFRYQLSSLYSVEFVFRRDAWTYGRNPNRDTRRSGFLSGGRFLLNSFSIKVNRWF